MIVACFLYVFLSSPAYCEILLVQSPALHSYTFKWFPSKPEYSVRTEKCRAGLDCIHWEFMSGGQFIPEFAVNSVALFGRNISSLFDISKKVNLFQSWVKLLYILM